MQDLSTIQRNAFNPQFQLREINFKLRKDGFLAIRLQWDSGLPLYLMWIHKNWSMYEHTMDQQVSDFVSLNMYKIFQLTYLHRDPYELKSIFPKQTVNVYEIMYPMMTQIIENFRKKLRIKSIMNKMQIEFSTNATPETNNQDKQENAKTPIEKYVRSSIERMKADLNIREPMTDLLFFYFLEQQRLLTMKKTFLNENYVKQLTTNLKKDVGKNNAYIRGNSQWSDLFNSIASYFSPFNETLSKDILPLQALFLNCENERLPNNKCLACSKFYFFNINIHDESAYRSPIEAYSTIHRLREMEAELRDQVCGMLNSEGGIILFDCERDYRRVIPHGEKMSQKNKEEYEQRIQSYLKFIYPKIQFGREVTISFVPIVDFSNRDSKKEKYTGSQAELKENRCYIKHPYKQGMFVTRIKVCPTQLTKVYFWQLSDREGQTRKYSYFFQPNGKNIPLTTRSLVKLVKKRMKKFQIPQQIDEELSKRLLGSLGPTFNHQCEQPQLGGVTNLRGNLETISNQRVNLETGEMCLVVVQRKNFQKLSEKLNQRNVICHIRTDFDGYKFKILSKTAILHHQSTFRNLQKELQHQAYDFDGKKPKIINLEGYLKLQRQNKSKRMRKEDFMNYYRLFSEEFPGEQLRVYEWYDTGEYYFQTESKLSMIFLYLQVKGIGEKVLFKYPNNWESMSVGERTNGLRMRYSQTSI